MCCPQANLNRTSMIGHESHVDESRICDSHKLIFTSKTSSGIYLALFLSTMSY